MYNQKPLLGTLPNYAHPLVPNVAAWIFNENSGNKVFDLSGNGHHGTFVNSPSWVIDPIMGVLSEDAGNRYIVVPHAPSLNPSGDFSMAVSFKSADTGNFVGILGKYVVDNAYVMNAGDNEGLRFHCMDTSIYTNDAFFDGELHQCIMTRQGTVGRIYVDGTERPCSSNTVSSSPITTTADLWIGGWGNNAYILDGTIHYVYIYDCALQHPQISQLYANPYCWLAQPMGAELMYAAPPVGAIINQFQKTNLGADLYDGVLIT